MTDLGSFVDDHPLYAEFKSLRAAVARFQDEAHASAIKFQRHTLDSSRLHDRVVHLERENDILKAEITILRANPHPDAVQAPPDSAQKISELTLSLRRLSQKLDVTEQSLLEKTTELTSVQAELGRARLSAENAYALGARVRGREEAGKARERELEWQLREKEEQRRILELAVGEYANLVRSLEAKLKGETASRNSGSSIHHQNGDASVNGLSTTLLEGKIGLQRLMAEFQKETEALQVRLEETLTEMDVLRAQDDAWRKGNKLVEEELGRVKTELEKLKIEDNTAAKMVSRYMQFSQRSTNSLQTALAALKTRHEATLNTLTSQSFTLSSQLRSSETTVLRLRDALDELGLEIMKETYGRRREVTQRLKLLNREERMMEALRRWGRRAEEAVARLHASAEGESGAASQEALLVMAQDARILLEGLDEGVMDEASAGSASGSKARWILSQSTIDKLLEELRLETERRIGLERILVVQEDTAIESISVNEATQNGHAHPDVSAPVVDDVATSEPTNEIAVPSSPELPALPPDVPATKESTPPHAPIIVEDAKRLLEHVRIAESTPVTANNVSTDPTPQVSSDLRTKPLPVIVDADTTLPPQKEPQKEPLKEKDTSSDEELPIPPASPANVPVTILEPTPTPPPQVAQDLSAEEDHTPRVPQLQEEKPPSIVEPTSPTSPLLETQASSSSSLEELTNAYPSPPAEETIPITLEMSFPFPSQPLAMEEVDNTPITGSDTPLDSLSDISPDEKDDCAQERLSESNTEEHPSEIPLPTSSQMEEIHETDASSKATTPVQDSHSTLPEISNCEDLSMPSETEATTTPSESPAIADLTIEQPPSTIPITDLPSSAPLEPNNATCENSEPSVIVSLPSPPSPSPPPPEPHPLLAALSQVSKRYDILQRSFRDCHLALESLKSSLRSQPASTGQTLPPEIFRAALDRLDDYTEDARVELEIRVSDEVLLIRGYETLLSVPGAFSSSTTKREELAILDQDDDEPTQNEVEIQIIAFVDGTDPAVKRAHDTFTRKLEDVQHDIAALKRAIYDPDALLPPAPATPDLASPVPTPSSSSFNLSGAQKSDDAPSKGGWTSWIRGGSSRPSSPAPQASTFGSIMTAPRLRSSPSTSNLQSSNQQAQSLGYGPPPGPQRPQGQRRGSFLGFGMGGSQADTTKHDPLAALALRVPMPNFGKLVADAYGLSTAQPGSAGLTPQSAYGFNLGLGFPGVGVASPTTPLAPGSAAPMRARTVSTMYMLGLGASASGGSSAGAMKGRTVSAGPGYGGLSPGLMSRQNSQASSSSLSLASSSGVSGSNHNYGRMVGVGLEKVDAGETDVENTDAESDDEGDDDDDIE